MTEAGFLPYDWAEEVEVEEFAAATTQTIDPAPRPVEASPYYALPIYAEAIKPGELAAANERLETMRVRLLLGKPEVFLWSSAIFIGFETTQQRVAATAVYLALKGAQLVKYFDTVESYQELTRGSRYR